MGFFKLLTALLWLILTVTARCHGLDYHLESPLSDQQDSNTHEFSSCDFESVCLWTLSNHTEPSDWFVASADDSEPSPVPRPHTDHSLGSSQGHFLELRASVGRCEYHLTSPVLPFSSQLCSLHLALSESTPAPGNLSLLILPVRPGSAHSLVTLFPLPQHSTRTQWEELQAVIGRMDEPFQVRVLYSSCRAEGGSVALDSVELRNCEEQPFSELDSACADSFLCEDTGDCVEPSRVCDFHTDCPFGEDEGFICGALPPGSYCSFELDDCGWTVSTLHHRWRWLSAQELDPHERAGTALLATPGHFLFLSVREGSDQRQESVYSPWFPAPVSSSHCQMHFSLYLYGDFNGTLVVAVEEADTANSPLVWERNGQWTDDWEDVALQLTGIEHRFQMKVTAEWSPGSKADIALDFISLSAACFHTDVNELVPEVDLVDLLSPLPEPSASEVSLMTWFFNSCGASGPHGPTQVQCDNTYRNKNISVTVGKEGSLKGVQMWRVPATNKYQITAYGAAGGKGAKNHNKRNHGIFISATFDLEKGDTLYILVGHQGEDACPGVSHTAGKVFWVWLIRDRN